MKTIFLFALTATAFFGFNACVKSPDINPDGGENTLKALPEAFKTPQDVGELTNIIVQTTARVIFQLPRQNGAPVWHGTLREVSGQYRYQDYPSDRLIYAPQSGGTIEFIFNKMEGDWSGDETRFLYNTHRLDFRINAHTFLDLAISSIQNGVQRTARAAGPVNLAGKGYDIDIQLEGAFTFNPDSARLSAEARLTGSIEGRDFKEALNEQWTFSSLYSAGKYSAERLARSFENEWTAGGQQFRFRNGYLQSAFRDGKPADLDAGKSPWEARGELLIDDQSYGNLLLERDKSHLRIWLQSGEQRMEMKNWSL
jgi:hypothetical protein